MNEDESSSSVKVISRSGSVYTPIKSFNEKLPSSIASALYEMKYKKPTTIQSFVWPIALKGKDLVGIAQTGSGKTLAYVIPSICHIKSLRHHERNRGPYVLILAPTRELAQQIEDVYRDFRKFSDLKSVAVFGGASKSAQAHELRRGAHIIVATPGRLIDFLTDRLIYLDSVSFLVLDEADQMLDMGFEPQIKEIMEEMKTEVLPTQLVMSIGRSEIVMKI